MSIALIITRVRMPINSNFSGAFERIEEIYAHAHVMILSGRNQLNGAPQLKAKQSERESESLKECT